jgi:hypothetical protein
MTAARSAIASDELTMALRNIAARGERTHCSDPELHGYWLSENPTQRAVAATLCAVMLSGCRGVHPLSRPPDPPRPLLGLRYTA